MGANDLRGGANFDPNGIVGRIHKEDHYILLHIKYKSSGPCDFGENIFLCFFFLMKLLGRGLYGPQGHVWQDL